MSTLSPLDTKARQAIDILIDRRRTWSVITYSDLGKLLGHPHFGLGQILDRVGCWSRSIDKTSLALLVINEQGKPEHGMFVEPVTPENYEQQRVRLWREDWTGIPVPNLEQIAAAYAAEQI